MLCRSLNTFFSLKDNFLIRIVWNGYEKFPDSENWIDLYCGIWTHNTTRPTAQSRTYACTHARTHAGTHACTYARTHAHIIFIFFFLSTKFLSHGVLSKHSKLLVFGLVVEIHSIFYFNFLHSSIYTITRTKFHTPPYFFSFIYIKTKFNITQSQQMPVPSARRESRTIP